MNLQLNLSPKQQLLLKQILSPQLIQMLKMFNLPYSELLQKVEEEAKENVFLDVVRYDQLLEYVASKKDALKTNFMGEEGDDFFARVEAKGQNLYEYLISQLNLLNLRPKENNIAKKLIEAINDRGYVDNYDLVKEKIKSEFGIDDRKVLEVLKIIQNFEPEGVGARDLKECLLIQIEEYNFEHERLREIFKKVVRNYLDDLGSDNFKKIAEKLGIEEEGVKALKEFIKTNLNPNPGYSVSGSNMAQIVIPSFAIKKLQNEEVHIVNLEKNYGVKVDLSAKYQEILKDPKIDEQTKLFLREKLKKAKELMENINKRQENLEKMIKFLATRQKLFLQKGKEFLEPLLQKEVAEYLNISPSTVSRIVAAKFVETPYGIFAFKVFCPRNFYGKTKERFLKMVGKIILENPTMSDQKISELMKNYNVDIARRTVTKYRHILGIFSHQLGLINCKIISKSSG